MIPLSRFGSGRLAVVRAEADGGARADRVAGRAWTPAKSSAGRAYSPSPRPSRKFIQTRIHFGVSEHIPRVEHAARDAVGSKCGAVSWCRPSCARRVPRQQNALVHWVARCRCWLDVCVFLFAVLKANSKIRAPHPRSRRPFKARLSSPWRLPCDPVYSVALAVGHVCPRRDHDSPAALRRPCWGRDVCPRRGHDGPTLSVTPSTATIP